MPIDLNADVGEGYGAWQLGDDAALLPHLTSANVACGFHAGDPTIMRSVCRAATDSGVTIGAQVGYPDLRGFGRRRIEVPHADLVADIVYQVGALDAFAHLSGSAVRYVKPHGALYNTAADDPAVADAVVEAVALLRRPLLGLAGSQLQVAAEQAGIAFVAEAYADRGYTGDGRLVPRSRPGAVITDENEVVARTVRIARDRRIATVDGHDIDIVADSLCLHGDTPGAVRLARAVRAGLASAGVTVASFAR